SQVPLTSWPEIIRRTREKAGDFVLIMDGYMEACAHLFDGVQTYNFAGELLGKNLTEIRTWAVHHYATAVRLAREHSRISCVTVLAGEDVTKSNPDNHFILDRQDGQIYRALWEEALKSKPDWVLITTFNEWYEATEIEPSVELGDKYLKITGEFAPGFMASPVIDVPAAPSPPRLAPGTRQDLSCILANRTVGALPDCALDSQFW